MRSGVVYELYFWRWSTLKRVRIGNKPDDGLVNNKPGTENYIQHIWASYRDKAAGVGLGLQSES